MHTINNANYIWKLARKKGITNYHNLSTDALIKLLCSAPFLYRKYINIVVENLGVNDPITKSTSYLVNIIEKYETSKKLTELGLNNIDKRNNKERFKLNHRITWIIPWWLRLRKDS